MDKLDKSTIVGQYALVGQENYEEYLKAIGKSIYLFMFNYLASIKNISNL